MEVFSFKRGANLVTPSDVTKPILDEFLAHGGRDKTTIIVAGTEELLKAIAERYGINNPPAASTVNGKNRGQVSEWVKRLLRVVAERWQGRGDVTALIKQYLSYVENGAFGTGKMDDALRGYHTLCVSSRYGDLINQHYHDLFKLSMIAFARESRGSLALWAEGSKKNDRAFGVGQIDLGLHYAKLYVSDIVGDANNVHGSDVTILEQIEKLYVNSIRGAFGLGRSERIPEECRLISLLIPQLAILPKLLIMLRSLDHTLNVVKNRMGSAGNSAMDWMNWRSFKRAKMDSRLLRAAIFAYWAPAYGLTFVNEFMIKKGVLSAASAKLFGRNESEAASVIQSALLL